MRAIRTTRRFDRDYRREQSGVLGKRLQSLLDTAAQIKDEAINNNNEIMKKYISGECRERLLSVLKIEGIDERNRLRIIGDMLMLITKAKARTVVPQWIERDKNPEYRDKSAIEFMKAAYQDEFINGEIQKESVRFVDPRLVTAVEQYILRRRDRNNDRGQAEDIHFAKRPKGKRQVRFKGTDFE